MSLQWKWNIFWLPKILGERVCLAMKCPPSVHLHPLGFQPAPKLFLQSYLQQTRTHEDLVANIDLTALFEVPLTYQVFFSSLDVWVCINEDVAWDSVHLLLRQQEETVLWGRNVHIWERDWVCGCVRTLTSADSAGVGALRLQEVSFPQNRKQVCNLIESVTVLLMYFYILQIPARGTSISSQIKYSL